MSAPPPIAKKPRLIIINKDKADIPSRGGGPPPLPIERSCAVGGRLPPLLACTRFNNKTWQEYQDWLNTNQQTYEQIYQRPLKCIYGAPREISHKKIPPQAKILVIEMNNDENKIMGIGEIINQTASEVYRSPHAVVPLANAHSTSPLAVVPLANAHSTSPLAVVPLANAHSTSPTAVVPLANAHSTSPSAVVPPLPPPHPTNRAELPSRGGGTPTRKMSYKIFSDRNYTRYIYIGNTRYASREELERNHTPDAQYINEHLSNIITMPQTPHHQEETILQYLERILFKGARHMKRGSGITGVSPPNGGG